MGRKTMEVGKDRQGETQELVLIWELLPTNPFQIAPWICYDTKGFLYINMRILLISCIRPYQC